MLLAVPCTDRAVPSAPINNTTNSGRNLTKAVLTEMQRETVVRLGCVDAADMI